MTTAKSVLIAAAVAIGLAAAYNAMMSRSELVTGAVQGRVFEVLNPHDSRSVWELEPLQDAEVLVVWRAEVDAFADSQFMCVRSASAKTGADGSFSVPAMKVHFKAKTARAASYAFKDGYVDVSVTSTAEEFGTTADHVRILRKATIDAQSPGRATQLIAAEGCPPT